MAKSFLADKDIWGVKSVAQKGKGLQRVGQLGEDGDFIAARSDEWPLMVCAVGNGANIANYFVAKCVTSVGATTCPRRSCPNPHPPGPWQQAPSLWARGVNKSIG